MSALDEAHLIDYVTHQRWYGAKSRSVSHADVLDSILLRTTEPQLALALVEMRYDTGAHDIYQLPFSMRGEEIEIDGLEDAHLARELVSAMRSGLTLQGAEGVIEFAPIEGFAGLGKELLNARPVGAEQSNSSIVFDEELILKVFRRLEPGINPELEMLRFLTEHGFPNIAPLGGWYAYSGGPLAATLGILQQFVANGLDGWELALQEVARPRRHSSSGSIGSGPSPARCIRCSAPTQTIRRSARRRRASSRSACSRRRSTRRSRVCS